MEAQIKFRSLGGKYERKIIVKQSHINNGYAIDNMIKMNAWQTIRHIEGYSTFAEALTEAANTVKELQS